MCQSEGFFPPKNGMNVLYLFLQIFFMKKKLQHLVWYIYMYIYDIPHTSLVRDTCLFLRWWCGDFL